MPQQTDFLYWLELPEAVPVELKLLPRLFASAMHRLPTDQFAAEEKISHDLDSLIKCKALKPRDATTMSPLAFSPVHTTAFLWSGYLLPSEVRSLAEQRGIGLRLVPHGVGPHLWTVANIVASYGPQPSEDELYQLIVDIARDGYVPYYHPITQELSKGSFDARASLLSKKDIDDWMSIVELPFRVGEVAKPWDLAKNAEITLPAESAPQPSPRPRPPSPL